MREHIVEVHILKVYTNITLLLTWRLQIWHKGNCTASAHHQSLWQTPQCESHPVRGAPAVGASLRDFPLTRRRNTQIQMYWLWKWLESYNNCTFSTWKDKFLFNLLFWIPNSFCTFHDYGRGGTPSLASPDGPSLIFYYSDFWTTFLPWKTELPWNFSLCWNIFSVLKYIFFLSFRTFDQLVLALKNRVCPEFTVLNKIHSEFWTTCACPENRVFPENFHCIEYSFYINDFWATCAWPEKQSVPWIHCITVLNIYFLSFRILNNLRLPWKTEFALKFFTVLKYFLSFWIFEQLELALKTKFALNFSSRGGGRPPASYATGHHSHTQRAELQTCIAVTKNTQIHESTRGIEDICVAYIPTLPVLPYNIMIYSS